MAFKRFIEILEELFTQKGDESILRYRGRDLKSRYIKGYLTPDGEPTLKTINGKSVKGSGDISTDVPVISVTGTTPSQKLSPNKFYKFGVVTSLTLTLELPEVGKLCIYAFSFTAGEDFDPSTDLSLPEGVVFDRELELEEGDFCEVSIRENKATFTVWSGEGDTSGVADPEEDGE